MHGQLSFTMGLIMIAIILKVANFLQKVSTYLVDFFSQIRKKLPFLLPYSIIIIYKQCF